MLPGIPYLREIDCNKLELKRARFHILSEAPLELLEACYWYNNTNGRLQVYNGDIKTVAYLDDITGIPRSEGRIYTASRNKKVTDSFLEVDGVFTNITPIVTGENLTLKKITASSKVPETWVAEIYVDDVLQASLSLSSEDKKVSDELDIDIPEGSCISFRVNGNRIQQPRVVIELIKA